MQRARTPGGVLGQLLDEAMRRLLVAAVRSRGGNVARTARDLGVSRRCLFYLLARYEVRRGELREPRASQS